MSGEYTAPTKNSSSCMYASLKNYNLGQPEAPLCGGTPSMAVQTVPYYCPYGPGPNYPPKYDTLQHGQGAGTCGGFFGIQGAYNYSDGKNCATKFVNRDCAGFINCEGIPNPDVGGWCP